MSTNLKTAAPTRRKKIAQGKQRSDAVLGYASQNTSSPEGAKEGGSRYHVQLPNLPASWSYQRFDKVLDVQGGTQPPKSTFVYEPTPGYVQLLQIRDFGKRGVPTFVRENSATKRCREDDILIARYGASLGRIVTGKGGAYNVALAKVIFDKEQFYNRYLFYLLQTPFFQTPIHMISRSAQNGFNKGDLSDVLLPVAPLPEQRRIVAEIEKQFTRLEAGAVALRRVQANLKRYRVAVLKAACEGRLVPTEAEHAKVKVQSGSGVLPLTQEGNQSRDGSATLSATVDTGEQLLQRILAERRKNWTGRGKYKEPASPDSAKLPVVPEGWTWATPDQLSDFGESAIYAGPFGTIFKARDFRPVGVPIIFLRHVAPGRYLTHKPGFMDEAKWEQLFRPYSVFGGELLITKLGEPPGICAIYPQGIGPAMVTPDVMKMTPNPAAALPKFLMHYFNSQIARDFATGVAFGTTRLRLTLPIFREMPVPLPPLVEQTRIVSEIERRLSVVEELEAVVGTNQEKATRLRQSILQRAFEGKLSGQAPD